MDYTLDLKGKSLGRAATEAAMILRGKNKADFAPNLAPNVKLKAINASKIRLTENKKEQKKYIRYSGYPSGLKRETQASVFEKNPAEVFRRAVWGMLAKNKLRSKIIKNLEIVN